MTVQFVDSRRCVYLTTSMTAADVVNQEEQTTQSLSNFHFEDFVNDLRLGPVDDQIPKVNFGGGGSRRSFRCKNRLQEVNESARRDDGRLGERSCAYENIQHGELEVHRPVYTCD